MRHYHYQSVPSNVFAFILLYSDWNLSTYFHLSWPTLHLFFNSKIMFYRYKVLENYFVIHACYKILVVS